MDSEETSIESAGSTRQLSDREKAALLVARTLRKEATDQDVEAKNRLGEYTKKKTSPSRLRVSKTKTRKSRKTARKIGRPKGANHLTDSERTKNYVFSIRDAHADALRNFGDGNASRGLRKLVEENLFEENE